MPNFSIFNTNPDDLRMLIFGRDGTNTSRALATDGSGRLTNISLDGTISSVLGATVTAGTLTNLLNGTISSVLGATVTAGTLTNLLNGTISSVLGATITAGTLSSVTSISQKSFVEVANTGVQTADAYTPLSPVTTAYLGTYSFFVYNAGPNAANLQVEISADGTHWYIDRTSSSLASGSVDVLVPSRFLKYTRLSYASSSTGAPTTIDVFFNAQGT
ncbi:MAG: DUF6385 domain-containing protein [Alicyclobacillaceae bacterium]|nr:DUF6385 domain-containing protein [Alicyclobacillaceae bacterium]